MKNLLIEAKNPARAVISDSFVGERTCLEDQTTVNYSKFGDRSEPEIEVRAEF